MRSSKAKFRQGTLEALSSQVETQSRKIKILEHKLAVAENKAQSDHQHFFSLFTIDNLQHPVLWCHPDGAIFYVNNATGQYTGYARNQLLHMHIYDIIRNFSDKVWAQTFPRIQQQKEFSLSSRIILKTGRSEPALLYFHYIELDTKSYCLCFFHTPKQQESHNSFKSLIFQQNSLLKIISRMSHDLNNHLTGIQGYSEIISMKSENDSDMRSYARHILSICEKAEFYTHHILSLANPTEPSEDVFDIHHLINKTCKMLNTVNKSHLPITPKLHAEFSKCTGNFKSYNLFMMHILVALSGTTEGPYQLIVRTQNPTAEQPEKVPNTIAIQFNLLNRSPKNPAQSNISSHDINFSAFENAAAEVVDLVHTTLEKSGATAQYVADSGKLKIFIPLSPPPKANPQKKQILFVDDVEIITRSMKLILQSLGYQVEICHTGKDAIAVYKKNPDKFDVVILDMVLPDITGVQVFEALKSINPKIIALLSSGYSRESEAHRAINLGIKGFLAKPFSKKLLQSKLEEILKIHQLPP